MINRCYAVFTPICQFLYRLLKTLVPLGVLLLSAYILLIWLPLGTSHAFSLYILYMLAIIAVICGLYLVRKRCDDLAYGVILGGFCMFYAACYQTYLLVDILRPEDLVLSVTVVNIWALIVALRLRAKVLAVISLIVASMLPSLFLDTFFTKHMLGGYFIILLASIMLYSYITRWFFLNIISALGYILYNPILFQMTSIEKKDGLLTIYEALWMMGTLFVIYTIMPLIYGFFSNKQRLFESLSITLGGAYTFAMSRFIIAHHLQWVKELPFFMKIFIRDVPTMGNVHMQMFFIYASVYLALFLVLFLVNRRATSILATLANLGCLSLFGLLYVHSITIELINYLVWFHDLFVVTVV